MYKNSLLLGNHHHLVIKFLTSLLINSSLRLEWKFSIWLINFSSSNKNDLNGLWFVVFLVTVSGDTGATGEGCTGAVISSSLSGGKATPTPVSDGIKSGGGNLGSRYGAEILV